MGDFVSLTADLDKFKGGALGDINFKDIKETLTKLKKPDIQECMIVQKCNCTEIYILTQNNLDKNFIEEVLEFWSMNSPNFKDEYKQLIDVRFNDEAIKHLLETSMGLKSVTIGDSQVYGQIRHAFKTANEAGVSGQFLKILQTNIRKLSKKVDEYSKFRRGNTSIPRAVGDIIKRKYKNAKILVVGLGGMGSLLTKILTEMKYEVTIINRTKSKAEQLTAKYKCKYRKLEELFEAIAESNIIIFATSTPYLINKQNIHKIFSEDKVFVDIGNPPNIEPELGNNLEIITLDFIKEWSKKEYNKRLKDVSKVKKLIDDELIGIKASVEFFNNQKLITKLLNCEICASKKLLAKILSDNTLVKFIKKRDLLKLLKMDRDSIRLIYLLKNNCAKNIFLEKIKQHMENIEK